MHPPVRPRLTRPRSFECATDGVNVDILHVGLEGASRAALSSSCAFLTLTRTHTARPSGADESGAVPADGAYSGPLFGDLDEALQEAFHRRVHDA